MPTSPYAVRQAANAAAGKGGYLDLGPYPATPQGWVDRGNAHLAQIGRAHECEWVLNRGQPQIQHRRAV